MAIDKQNRLVVHPSDLMQMLQIRTYNAALQRKRRYLLQIGKKATDKLTVFDLSKILSVPVNEIRESLPE